MKTFLFFLLMITAAEAQVYPKWFLFPDRIPCPSAAIKISRAPSLYRDTAIAVTFRAACDLAARYAHMTINGGQAFWTTEAGVHSMGSQYTEQYDIAHGEYLKTVLAVVESFVDKQKTIVMAGDSAGCAVPEELRAVVPVSSVPQPKWVEELPVHQSYHYGVGTSEEYYYESSSWERAENNAVMSVARSRHTTVMSLQKSTAVETQDVFNEEMNVELKNVRIVGRWRDVKKKVFYVLARMAK